MHLGLKNWPIVPHNPVPIQGTPVPLLKFQMTLIVEDSVNPADLFRRTTLHILQKNGTCYCWRTCCLSHM